MSLFSDTTLFEICLVCLRNCITLVMYTWGQMKGGNIMFHGHLVLNIMHAWTLNRINLLPAFSKNGSHQTKYWQNHSNAYQIRTHKLFFIYRYTQKRKCHIYDIFIRQKCATNNDICYICVLCNAYVWHAYSTNPLHSRLFNTIYSMPPYQQIDLLI